MDFNALVDVIVAKVAEKLAEAESMSAPQSVVFQQQKPKLLILTNEHGDICHDTLEHGKLLEYYQTECALLKNYECNVNDYEAIIIFGLDNKSLAKLSSGSADTAFTELAQKAILCGKKIFIIKETVELYKYNKTAPEAYYQMMLEKLEFLVKCGIVICEYSALTDMILSGDNTTKTEQIEPEQPEQVKQPEKEVLISKRVVTERDISEAAKRDVCCVRVGKRAILTELAKEYLQARHITLVRDE